MTSNVSGQDVSYEEWSQSNPLPSATHDPLTDPMI